MSLLQKANRRHFYRHPLQLALAVLGIALGVAMLVSVDLAIESSRRAFELSMRALTGKTTHHIVAGSGTLDERLYPKLRRAAGSIPMAPVVEGYGEAGGETFRLAGFDPFADLAVRERLARSTFTGAIELLTEPGTVLISRISAHRLGIGPGGILLLDVTGMQRPVRVVGYIDPEGEPDPALEGLLLADIATAQEVLDKLGRLDRIDVILPLDSDAADTSRSCVNSPFSPRVSQKGFAFAGHKRVGARTTKQPVTWLRCWPSPQPSPTGRGGFCDTLPPGEGETGTADALRRLLPNGVELVDAAGRATATARMSHAFEINLRAMSLLALLVGTFLIYNTMSFAVLQRRRLLADLRALGATRRELTAEILWEAALLGLVGGTLGLLLGLFAAQALVGLVSRTINDVYFVLTVTQFSVAPAALLRGLLLGILASLCAALPAAFEAASIRPAQAQRRSGLETRTRRWLPMLALLGAAMAGVGAVLLNRSGNGLIPAIAGVFLLLMGYALATPLALLGLARLLAWLPFTPVRLAIRGASAALSRTGAATAALTVAVAAAIGVGLMVESFRVTIDQWLEQLLQADLYLARPAEPGIASRPLPTGLVDAAVRLPGVAAYSLGRRTFVESPQGRIEILALRPAHPEPPAFRFKAAEDAKVWARFLSEEIVLISEPFATRHGLDAGDTLSLETPEGSRRFPIAGVFFDYRSDQGIAVLRYEVFERLWPDPGTTSLGLYLDGRTDPEDLRRTLLELAHGTGPVAIRSNREIREASMELFRRTFAITHVLRVLAIAVAFIGILSALLALQLERTREFAVLRALGVTPRQLVALVLGQTGFLGLCAGLLALPLGLLLAYVLVAVINLRSFGWSMDLSVSAADLWQAPLLALTAALLAGIFPARRAGRFMPAAALREE